MFFYKKAESGWTQKDEVLRYLNHKGSITAFEGFTKLYIVDLAGVIRDLRKEYVIDDEWIYKINFYGHQVRYKKYFLVGLKSEILKQKKAKNEHKI